MGYLPKRFPSGVASNPVGGPTFSTGVVILGSGIEQRNQNWEESRHEFEFSHGIKNDRHFKEIGAHFRMARGRKHKFRVLDWADYEAARDEGSATSIDATHFQLIKRYGELEDFWEERRITRPVSGTLSIWLDDVLATGGAYSIDYETGIITFSSPPGAAVIEAAFRFDVPCRYDTDKLQATLVKPKNGANPGYHSWTSVPVVEVRE